MIVKLNYRNLFEALIGYGKYGDSQLEKNWDDKDSWGMSYNIVSTKSDIYISNLMIQTSLIKIHTR